jgi:hypothetical protein
MTRHHSDVHQAGVAPPQARTAPRPTTQGRLESGEHSMKRRTSVAGWPSETNHSPNRLASRSAALSQNYMCSQRRIARFGSLYEEWRTVLFELVFARRYSVWRAPCAQPSPRSFGGFLYSPVRLPQGVRSGCCCPGGVTPWLVRGHVACVHDPLHDSRSVVLWSPSRAAS